MPSSRSPDSSSTTRGGQPDRTDQNSPQPVPAQIGRYEIREVLGEGGFGRVYLAYDPQLQRKVALKVPRQERLSSEERVAAFLHEARSAAQLKHPGLVVVHDVQQDGDDIYIVQEYIDGQDLAHWARDEQSNCPSRSSR